MDDYDSVTPNSKVPYLKLLLCCKLGNVMEHYVTCALVEAEMVTVQHRNSSSKNGKVLTQKKKECRIYPST